jgi:predicted ArsR family transcriptional regulator
VFDVYVSDRLAKASKRSLANARTLRTGLAAAYSVLGGARASSKVHGIAELLFAGHPLNVMKAAKLFSVSRLVARKHLLRLEQDGLAERATRAKSGAIFVARDGLMTFGQALGRPLPKDLQPLNVGGSNPLTSEHRQRLEAISDDIASRVQELDSLLDRLSSKTEP